MDNNNNNTQPIGTIYNEDKYLPGAESVDGMKSIWKIMNETAAKAGQNLSSQVDAQAALSDEGVMKQISEAVTARRLNSPNLVSNNYLASDLKQVATANANVVKEILNEAVGADSNLSPITLNSFGIQEKSIMNAHLPKAVKMIIAKTPSFKLSERRPYFTDLSDTRNYYDTVFNSATEDLADNLLETVNGAFSTGSRNTNIKTSLSIDATRNIDAQSFVRSVVVTNPSDDSTALTSNQFSIQSGAKLTPSTDKELVTFNVDWAVDANTVGQFGTETITIQYDLKNGMILSILSSNNDRIPTVNFTFVLSPADHVKALKVGFDIDNKDVDIPNNEHIEYSLSEEFKDSAKVYRNIDAMSMGNNDMARAVEHIKDIKTREKYIALGNAATGFKFNFSATPDAGYSRGRERWIKEQFHPTMEQICGALKRELNIGDAHFRCVGNPQDIRIPDAAGVNYVYKRSSSYMGDIITDYDFAVITDVHTIFYLSSDRIRGSYKAAGTAAYNGRVYCFLIPNTIVNNIITVNHYEYVTFVSKAYRGTGSGANLPTSVICSRYKTEEYRPVLAQITMLNNYVEVQTA